jgi:mannose-6-phosphate isomerase-like protein (cupin superfamily)
MTAQSREPLPFIRQAGEGPTMNVLGMTHVYKAMSVETGDAFSIWEAIVPPGHGAPPHTHAREDEAFYVLSGELTIELEGEPVRAGPGTFFFGRRGRQHAIRNATNEDVRALILCTPGAGLDRMFGELDAASAAGMPPVETIVEIAGRADVAIATPA